MKYCFVEVGAFLANRDACFRNDRDFRDFQLDLMEGPGKWPVIPGGSPLRKARWGDTRSGKGKSGGVRIIYMVVPQREVIILVHVYPKSKQGNLSRRELNVLAALAKKLFPPK